MFDDFWSILKISLFKQKLQYLLFCATLEKNWDTFVMH